jgi:hypothetical protein
VHPGFLQLRVVKMESCVKLFVDTAVMSTALKALQSSRIGRHTRERPYVRQPTPHRGCSPQPHRGESHAAERFTGMYNYMTVLTPVYMFDRGPGGGEKGNLRPPCTIHEATRKSEHAPRRDRTRIAKRTSSGSHTPAVDRVSALPYILRWLQVHMGA